MSKDYHRVSHSNVTRKRHFTERLDDQVKRYRENKKSYLTEKGGDYITGSMTSLRRENIIIDVGK